MNNGYQNAARGPIMQRPLFRQAGGPAQPSPEEMAAMGQQYLMQPPAAAAPQSEGEVMAMLQEGESAGMAQGQQMGEMYGEATMQGLDAADDAKGLIDAIRGTAAPLEARYAELAGLVGEEDAQKTPESVLALVQPTIMMTEEGAVDSGIGELMKGLMGEVEMSEGSGMSQGVGELMAMGAGNTPPANFRNGGPVEVRRFDKGGSVISEAQRMAPEFQKYFEGSFDQQARSAALQEQREMSQAQMLFDIAGTALNFAGNTQGRSIAERLANAASQTQLTDKIGTRAAGMLSAKQAQAAEDRQMRMAGLQAGLGQAQTNKAAADALELAAAKSTASKPVSLAPGAQLFSADGKLLATNSTVIPKTTTLSAGQSVFDEKGVLIASMPAKPVTYSLSAGQAAYDAEGNLIVERADKPQIINLAPGAIAYDGNGKEIARGADKPAVTHLLGKDQQLVGADGTVIAKGKETKETVTLGAGQQVVDVATGEVIAKGPNKFEAITMYSVVDGKVKKESVNVGTPEGLARAEELQSKGFVPDNDEAMAFINDAIAKDKENRGVVITKDTEQRAIEQEAVIYGRNRADELADIDAAVARKIEEEERAQGRTLTAEERAQITWQARFDITSTNDLDRLAVAQGLKDASQINSEDRAAIVAQNKFEQDQAAKIAAENRAVANRDTIELRQVNGELVRVDTLTGETKVLFGEPEVPDPSMAQVTLRNAEGVPVTTVIDITSPQGKALIEKVNAANAATPGSASFQKVPTASTTVQGYLIYNEDKTVKGVYTSYDGKTYIDDDGNAQIITGASHPVNDTIAYDVAKNEKLVSSARAQLQALDSELISQMTTFDKDGKPIALNKKQQAEVRDAFAAARKGTGFWSKVYAGIDAVAAGIAPGLFSDLFKDTTDARQFVKMVRVLGRSALASSPRFAMGDLNAVQGLFPDEQALFRSPSTEAAKLNDIVGYLDEEKRRLLGKIASGEPMDSAMKSQVNQKLFEINRLETILGPVAMLGEASVNQEAIDAAKASMRKKKN